jgi:opacity protein-like surface antigen
MFRARLTVPALATMLTLLGASAQAADYPQPPPYMPPPQQVIIQPAPEFAGKWYLRGQIGVGMMGAYSLDVTNVPATGGFASDSISDSYFIGFGAGYEWNNWLRFDGTVEYRAKAQISALGHYQPGGAGPVYVDNYQGNLKSWVFLANAYADLGTWDCFTPFVGVGVGAAVNSIADFSDISPTVPGGAGSAYGVGRGTSTWNFAWALYAGLTYNVTNTFKVDLTYRYLSLGKAKETVDCAGGCGGTDLTFKDLYSNDFMLGLRWECCELPPPPPPVVYQPPPPSPLQSRG